ncbi:MAG: hypothetical protein ABIL62_05675 [Planctomycetota bacterium]
MADGGFVVKFDDSDEKRCYAISFDYDEWFYKMNNEEPRAIPQGTKKITVKIE